MSGPHRQFHPAELRVSGETDPTVAESANTLSMARDLEALAANDGIRPTDGFEDRVMAAIAAEPAPRVVVRPGSAVRGGWLGAFVLAVRDAWGVAATGGRPTRSVPRRWRSCWSSCWPPGRSPPQEP